MAHPPGVSRPRPSSFGRCLLALTVPLAVGLAACSNTDANVSTATAPPTIDITQNPNGGSFRILTYNVAGLPVEISASRPDVNLPRIGPLLNAYELVVTQEDYDWWAPGGLASTVDFVNYHGRLRAKATHDYQSPAHPGAEAVGIERPELELGDGLGTLSRLPANGDERVPWADCFGGFNQDDGGKADCLAMKGFQVTQVTLANGGVVHVYNNNAEAGTNPRDQELQAANFEQLAAHIASQADGAAVIVAGDTNLHLDDTHAASGSGQDRRIWERFLASAGLTDACTAGECDPELIDRVAYRSGADVDLAATAFARRGDRFVDADGASLSDHDPVEVSFDWKPA